MSERFMKKFCCRRSFRYFGFELDCAIKSQDGESFEVLQAPAVVNRKRGDSFVDSQPMLVLEDVEATALMDALWEAGVRPTSGEGNVGMVGAMKEHISDLRDVVAYHHAVDMRVIDDRKEHAKVLR